MTGSEVQSLLLRVLRAGGDTRLGRGQHYFSEAVLRAANRLSRRAVWPPARNASRQCVSVAAVNVELARQAIQRFPAQQAQDRLCLPARQTVLARWASTRV